MQKLALASRRMCSVDLVRYVSWIIGHGYFRLGKDPLSLYGYMDVLGEGNKFIYHCVISLELVS